MNRTHFLVCGLICPVVLWAYLTVLRLFLLDMPLNIATAEAAKRAFVYWLCINFVVWVEFDKRFGGKK